MTDTTGCTWGHTEETGHTSIVTEPTDPVELPHYPLNLYSRSAIRHAHTCYRALRDLGPVVWSTAQPMFVVSRYAEVCEVLADDATFGSGDAVSMTALAGWTGASITLVSDSERHAQVEEAS